jgi:hypothetical protein
MALDKTKLKNSLIDWMEGTYDTTADSMTVFIDKYESYSLDATDISGDSPLLYFKTNALNILKTLTNTETPQTASVKFENALIAYWLGATFKLLTPPPGTVAPEITAIVTVNIAPGPLATALASIFSDLSPSATKESKATQIADALDTATKTIVVTCTGTLVNPPYALAVPGPIS